MRHQDLPLGEKETSQGLADLLIGEVARLCSNFREETGEETLDDTGMLYAGMAPTAYILNLKVGRLLDSVPQSAFTKGVEALGIRTLAEAPQALFYCFAELFQSQPITPVDASYFVSPSAIRAFKEGIDTLLRKELVTAVSINSPEESRARKDRYILSPLACSRLFRGREELVSASVAAQFGSILRWRGIPEKELLFPDDLRQNLSLVSRAISRERFEEVRQGLRQHGFRGGLTFLLSGPPGTGKTEFVRQLARYEHRNIFQVDAGKLDGSYFGEKPRNLRELFLFSRYMSAIMPDEPLVFIDEADSLLGRRVEAARSTDREENLAVNIILEEMNTFSGILFAATNNVAGLDPAMLRRFLLRVVFPVPDVPLRARIWRTKLPFLTETEALEIAGRFSLSGGLIDNVASLCLLERIVYGKDPSYERLVQHCEMQAAGNGKPAKKIGF